MREFVDFLMISIAIANLLLLSSSRLASCIKLVSFQGVVIALFPVIFSVNILWSPLIISLFMIMLKGAVFPWLLFRALKMTSVKKEIGPLIGYRLSTLIGLIALILSFWIATHLLFLHGVSSFLVVPISFFTTFVGLLVIISRAKAITQVLGYLVIENGIYMVSFVFLIEQPFLVEVGILLDVFVAIFVMGIAISYIHKEFDNINTKNLSELKD